MTKTYEDGLQFNGEPYRVRLYEDMIGHQEPIFIVERNDGKPMTNEQVRHVFGELKENYEFDKQANPKLWEQFPDGKVTEHTFRPYTYDSNPDKIDMGTQGYEEALKSGGVEPHLTTGYNHSRTEVSLSQTFQETGQVVQSFEQRREHEWATMSGPKL